MKINILKVKNGDRIKVKGIAKILKIIRVSKVRGVWSYRGGKLIMDKFTGKLHDVKSNGKEKLIKSRIVEVI